MTKIDYWVFDLDNTLYPAENNLFAQVDRRMGEFIAREFDLDYVEAKALQKKYFHTYGTTLRGLMTERDIAPEDFLEFVHDIDFSVLRADHRLNQALRNITGNRIIYTNASTEYAIRVLEKLGIDDLFDHIFDIKAADFQPKPAKASYQKMADTFGIDPQKSVMVEDIARNLIPAREMGMKTVWVKNNHPWAGLEQDKDHIDHTVVNLADWLERQHN